MNIDGLFNFCMAYCDSNAAVSVAVDSNNALCKHLCEQISAPNGYVRFLEGILHLGTKAKLSAPSLVSSVPNIALTYPGYAAVEYANAIAAASSSAQNYFSATVVGHVYTLENFEDLGFFDVTVASQAILILCFLSILSFLGEFGEKRFLAFLILMEILLVMLSTVLLLYGLELGINVSASYTTTLCVLASGGADTALALALFIAYFKVSGKTILN